MRWALDEGATPNELAEAYSVSYRTIYRTMHRVHREVITTLVGPYAAEFEIGDDGPQQITRWRVA